MKQPIPFGKYFLLERVNVGGMAEVFRAKATGVEGFERLVAVKRILPGIAEDEEFVTMFKDEAKIAVQLTHANIAQIFDLGRADGSFYIALEYIHGKDLRAIMNRVRQRADQLPVAFACYVIMKVCEGLDYAHSKHDGAGQFLNLVHRDVSPQNLLVSYEGEVKIIDFGIAKAAGKVGRTQAGILKGKFGYMSPEQILGLEIDRRSDVFGVGICLYELLTGERLFAAETDFATLEKVRAGTVLPPSSFNPRVPEELEQIVLRALAKDRDARYQSAVALHDALQAFLHTSGSVFGRKDLALYMHRVFADEIEKENARDVEYARIVASDVAHKLEDGVRDDDAVDVSPRAYAPTVKVTSKAHAAADVRKRTGTLLGVPVAAIRLPTVPRPIPNPASIPPLAHGSSASRPPEPSRPSLQAVAPELAHAMDWDDEELSTQIYDKPELDAAIAEAEAEALDADGLDAMQPSLPDSVEPDAGLAAVHYTGKQQIYPARTSDPGPQPLRLAPPPAAMPREPAALALEEPAQPTRGRPMLAAVVTVLAIISVIVLGLLAFRARDPGTVSLSTRPSRVEVSVDGRALGSSMSPFVIGELTPDRPHEIVVSSAGHAPWTKTLTLSPGQVMTLTDVVLEPIETGFVIVTEPAEANLFLDEKALSSRSPLRIADLSPGEHRLRVELSGYASWESTLSATKGTVLPLPIIHLSALPSAAPVNEPSTRPSRRAVPAPERERGRAAADPERASSVAPAAKPPTAAQPQPPPEPEVAAEAAKAADDDDSEPARKVEAEPEVKNPYRTETEQAAKAEPSVQTGKLRVNSRPWSQIFIDGKAYGATPKLNIELPVGTHNLRLVNDEFKIEKVEQVEIAAGETRSVIINLMDQ